MKQRLTVLFLMLSCLLVLSYWRGERSASATANCLACPACPSGNIMYVNANVAGGAGDGSSWINAYSTLTAALAATDNCTNVTQIWVAQGKYKPADMNGDQAASFTLKNGLAIYGGFSGNGMETQLSQRNPNPATNGTVLSGDLNDNDIPGDIYTNTEDNCYTIVQNSGVNNTAILDGFTISDNGGNVTQPDLIARTCGMFNENSSPTLRNLIFRELFGGVSGGMFNFNSSPTLTNVSFNGNLGGYSGGMLNEYNSSSTLTNVTFSGNVTLGEFGSQGGGMVNLGSSPTLINVTFSGNYGYTAGAMYNSNSSPTLRNCILWGDSGGEIVNNGASPTVTYSLVQGGYHGTGNLDADPRFLTPVPAIVPAAYPTPTTGGDLRPGPGSPAINAGDNCVLTANGCGNNQPALTADLRGLPRQVGGTVDMGAYEVNYALAATSGVGQSAPVNTAFAMPLVAMLTESSQPLSGLPISFTVLPANNGASAALSGLNPTPTNSNGQASVNATANSQTGGYAVQASASVTGPTVSFALTNSCAPLSVSSVQPVEPTCPGGTNGSLTVQASGGIAPLQYSRDGGQTFQSANVFNNLAAGGYAIVVKDANGCPSAPYPVTLSHPAALSLSPGSLPPVSAGQALSQVFTASGGTGAKTVSLQGALPNWLSFSPATATLSGAAPQPTTVSFTLVVTDAANCTASFNYTLNFVCPTLSLTPLSLPNGVQGMAYNQTLTTSPAGGNYSYAVIGALPPGLSLASNGVLSGTPTAGGNYTFNVTVTGWGTCTKTQNYNLLITGTCATITVNPTGLPAGTLGTAYSQSLSATGGTAPYTYSLTVGALPTGITLNPSTGELTGTPTVSGTFAFTLRATGQGGCSGTRQYVLSIGCGTLTFSPATLPNGASGVAYSQQITASPASSATFSLLLGGLPPGFTLSSTGLLSGTTTQANTYNFTVKAVAGTCQASKPYTLVIGVGSSSKPALALSGDYDGDGQSDPALWSAKDGVWRIVRSSDGQAMNQRWGTTGDVTLLGDFDGDGKSDLAVFRPADATFYVKRSSDGGTLIQAWGLSSDIPVPGDYDGDGKTDIAVWRGAEGNWYVLRSSDGQTEVQAWGASYAPYFDVPVSGDYDGDGKSDLAVFRRGNGTWFIKRSRDGQYLSKLWGLGMDVPVAQDYDGDGQTDIAVWRPAEGNWYIWQSATSQARVTPWGQAGDQPSAGDYDGDGQADPAVWREVRCYIWLSASRTTRLVE